MNAAYEQTIDEIHDAIRELRAKIEYGLLPHIALDTHLAAARQRTDWTEPVAW